jgi:DNA topoisomerase-1
MENDLDEVEDGKKGWRSLIADFYAPFKRDLDAAEESIGGFEIKDEETDIPCEMCGRMMVIKQGRYGKFLACPGYPTCKNAKPINDPTGLACPICGAMVVVRKSRKGKEFYICEKAPECEFISWDEPTNEKCPKCGNILMKKTPFRGRKPQKKVCFNKDCDYEEKI